MGLYSGKQGRQKPPTMSRLIVLIIIAVLIVGGLYFLSTVPKEQPTRTVEVDVPQPGNAQ
jgi:hypothetical protein